MTLAEFPDADLPAHRNSVAAMSWLRKRLLDLTTGSVSPTRRKPAHDLTLVLEGVHATGQSLGPDGPAKRVRHVAEVILSTARRD